jgi:hypothetical protein
VSASTATHVTVRVPLNIRRPPGRKTVVTPVNESGEAAPRATFHHADPALVKALARAFRYQRMLDEGRYASITEMAATEQIERGYLGSLLRLTLLAPKMVQAILDGMAPADQALPRLTQPFTTTWADQQRLLRGVADAACDYLCSGCSYAREE